VEQPQRTAETKFDIHYLLFHFQFSLRGFILSYFLLDQKVTKNQGFI
jgi:hypothetical protein